MGGHSSEGSGKRSVLSRSSKRSTLATTSSSVISSEKRELDIND